MIKPKLKVGVKVNGGFGTVLVRANFLHCLYEYIDDAELQIYVYGHISRDINLAVFEGQPSIAAYDVESNWRDFKNNQDNRKNFALLFELDIYPRVECFSEAAKKSPKLSALIEEWENFRKDRKNEFYYQNPRRSKPYEYSKLILQYKHILNSADVSGRLDVGREYRMPAVIFQNENEVLDKFGLSGKKYITLQRGINPMLGTIENNKLWPVRYFNELIRMIKDKFPEYTFVQLGESAEHCAQLEGIDIDLLGATTWDDIKILLKNAVLHIDGECGFVHLRKSLHAGPSLVFFGPTPVELFGYDGNFNMFSTVCGHWCAELREDWEYHCLKDIEQAPCMYAVTPEMAMDAVSGYLTDGNTDNVYNMVIPPLNKTLEIAGKYGDRMDKEFVENYFIPYFRIYDYEVKEVPVSRLKASVFDGENWNRVPLAETPAYQYLSGDTEAYERNMSLRKNLDDNVHSFERFKELIESVKEKGFDDDILILINEAYNIEDGQHRAALWMSRYGMDSTIPVLMVYTECV